MVYCQECGTENPENANFCKECGAKINIHSKTIFKEANENRGIIGYLGLTKWFDSLPETEKSIIRNSHKNSGVNLKDIDSGNIKFISMSQTQFLHGIANLLANTKGEDRKIELLIKSLDVKGTAIDKHFVYNDLIGIYGKKADFKTTLYYCKLDIELIENDEEAKKFLKDCVIPSIEYVNEVNEYRKLIGPLNKIFNENEVLIQKNLYNYPEFIDKRQILSSFLYWLDRGNYIIRSKKGNSYELKLKVPLTEIF